MSLIKQTSKQSPKGVYVLNPAYKLKADGNKVIIHNREMAPEINDFIGFVHPVYAILFSFFDGKRTLNEVVDTASTAIRTEKSIITKLIYPLLENTHELYFTYDGYKFSCPQNLLVRANGKHMPRIYNAQSLFVPKSELDMEVKRLNSPLDVLFVINTRCYTDCVYCYADRRRKKSNCQISLERLKELIREAKAIDMRSFDISGGELFLYEYWEELLTELSSNGFYPYISTKCPLDEKTILKLKELGFNHLQISIDSIKKCELVKILKVNEDYRDKILNTLSLLDKYGFEIYTNSQITSINQQSIPDLIKYLLGLKNIKRINLGVAGFSLYLGEEKYKNYMPDLESVRQIDERIKQLKSQYPDNVVINFSDFDSMENLNVITTDEKRKNFADRSMCSGNFYAFCVLPDGKVTICEELYWHPKFIIGDLTHQSITEAWNSEKALDLYNLTKEVIRQESECKKCNQFDACHKQKGICWKEILYAYGLDNWDYPDPKCPKAPKPYRNYYL